MIQQILKDIKDLKKKYKCLKCNNDIFSKVYTLENTVTYDPLDEQNGIIGTIPDFGDNFSFEVKAIHTSTNPTNNGVSFGLTISSVDGNLTNSAYNQEGSQGGFDFGFNTSNFCYDHTTHSFNACTAGAETFTWKIIVYNVIVL
jgi:hypothetical protein